MKKIVKDALVLFAITLVAGILLGVVYQITLDPIAKANENAKEKAYKAVLAEADSFETIDALPSEMILMLHQTLTSLRIRSMKLL